MLDMLSNTKDNFRAGKVNDYLENWTSITSDLEILESIQGLKINFLGPLPPRIVFQHKFGTVETEFISSEVTKLLDKGVIRVSQHEKGEFISPIFVTPKSDGGFRLILNLKLLNYQVPYIHFKMDILPKILELIRPGVFMSKIDIKDAYYSIPIEPNDTKFLKFTFMGVLYEFLALPNGYKEGPRRFTKLLKPALASLRENRVCLAAYIDDIIVISSTFNKGINDVLNTSVTFDNLGFTLNIDKSVFTPCQTIEFLGFVINSIDMTVSLTPTKKASLKSLCEELLNTPSPSIRRLATLIGKIASSFVGVPLGKLYFRHLERTKTFALKASKGNFDKPCSLDLYAMFEINWWFNNIESSWAPIIRENPSSSISTDASNSGWGAVFEGVKTGGAFDETEKSLHINILEAKAVLFGLKSLCSDLSNTHILILTDNTATKGAINNMGSSKSLLFHFQIFEIWKWAIARNIWLSATHLPGILNVEADIESRRNETKMEWKLDADVFQHAISVLKFIPEVDLFASRINSQLAKFFAYRHDPEAMGVNAFSISWNDKKFYAFPPFAIISRVIQKIVYDNAMGILVVPNWPNQIWFSLLEDITISFIILPPSENLLLLPQNLGECHPLAKTLRLRVVLVSAK